MADTVYRRSGRGGAGNFYSQKDIEEATKRKSEDLEAQKSQPLADDEPLTDPADGPAQPVAGSTTNGAKAYARSGRGGAGNFVDVPSSPVATTAPTHASKPQDQSHPQSPPTSPRRGGALSGRGGAGNWTSEHGEGEPYDREQERKRREALDAHILEDIRDSLPQPPKIHYMHGPGRGRKPDPLS
ncbi:hypothetical protein F5Y00DRAFT_184925 [Daldinia vernicosa]|uniref:uncharacterized protein n=1 Tax=Daldinia vernicosa TaxID=114800 RepID=UPI00200784FB|nr:uncharacterized protein F5Y00DRAFT_184925 [Daldinia vernicosa]KAI0844975.1 hypothetical protein F5Y00DRAFT_184925 [Daldinia vernicosa]